MPAYVFRRVPEVLSVPDGAFRTDFRPATEKVFVHGLEVDDFRNVDYEATRPSV